MAILVLALWTLTVAIGVYMLVTSTRPDGVGADAQEAAPEAPAHVPAAQAPLAGAAAGSPLATEPRPGPGAGPGAGPEGQAAPRARRPRDVFDPPSLARAKSEPMPGKRAFAEFLHPALAICGYAFWLIYTMSRAYVLEVIALGIVTAAVVAGLSWARVNNRGVKRDRPDPMALSVSPRVLLLHAVGATLTVLLAALIAVRVV